MEHTGIHAHTQACTHTGMQHTHTHTHTRARMLQAVGARRTHLDSPACVVHEALVNAQDGPVGHQPCAHDVLVHSDGLQAEIKT